MKDLLWVGNSLKDMREFPDDVKQFFGFELHQLQLGLTPPSTKPLKGSPFKGVYELKKDFDGDTFRTVYIAKLKDAIYVLHCFQKKSKSGIATPKKELDLIAQRLKWAKEESG
jgi:phage-related protein